MSTPPRNVGLPGNFIACTLTGASLSFDFRNFECPNEEVDHVGGHISMVIHKFPGGRKTTQTFGWFPADAIRWRGQFFNDDALTDAGSMYDRLNRLKQMAAQQATLNLTIGQFQYQVMIQAIEYPLKLQFWIPYTIVLIPVLDLNPSTFASPGTNAPTFSSQAQLASGQGNGSGAPLPGGNANNPGTTSPTSPASGTQTASSGAPLPGNNNPTLGPLAGSAQVVDLNTSNQQLANQLTGSGYYPSVPPDIVQDLSTFQLSLTNAIQQSLNNNTPLVATGNLQQQLFQALADTELLKLGDDPGNAAFGSQTGAILGNITSTLSPVPPVADSISAVNPNLNQIAEEKYGDPTQWTRIADANPQYPIYSANPTGVFDLIIPLSDGSTLTSTIRPQN